jgi:hypothetical protein
MPADPAGQELPDASTDAVLPGDAPASGIAACVSPTVSAAGAPPASAASGSQKTVTTPSTVRRINVAVTTAEVRSGPDADGAAGGFVFGGAAIGRSISKS